MDPSTTPPLASQLLPLSGDVTRQAMDSLAGYDYQILRTVEAWLQLRSDEKIYIECAEDYDVIRPDGAVATQLKNSPGNITLNSEDVRDAVQNFWDLLERNAGRERIAMRFLTRGSIGREQKSALGEPGILVWRKAVAGNDDAALLVRDHLLGQGGSDTFLEFLRTADAKRLREQFLSRIEWVTDEPSAEVARLVVNRLAINMGRSANIPPGICERAVPSLLDHCRQAAIKKEAELRSLMLGDAQAIFDRHTSLSVPITQALVGSVGAMIGVSSGGAPTSIGFTTIFDGELPELPVECMPRGEFISGLKSELRAKGAVLVVGAEGEGKSTAANLVARTFAGAFWMDLRGGDEAISAAAIENAIVLTRSGKPVHCLVLDDVPVAQGVSDVLWGRLRILIDSCRRTAIPLVMTSKGVPADAVDPRFQAASAPTVPVPRISEAELIAYLELLGCSDKMSQGWARMTLAHTGSGHPKLVHLAALELRDRRWTAADVSEFVNAPRSVQDARVAARQQASKNVPLPDRELLFALALTSSPFGRDVALQLATRLKIDEPGAVFDRLDGRWVERIGKTLYRATPLLNGQTPEVWAEEKVQQAHGLFFDAYIATKTISLPQAMTLILHGLQARDGRRLAGFLTSLAMQIESTGGLLEALELLVHFGDMDDARAIDFHPQASLLMRYLQFRVARARRPEMLPDMARRWLWEINQESHPQVRSLFLGMRGMCIATAIEGTFPASVVVEGLEHVVLLERLLEAEGMGGLPSDALDGEDPLAMMFLIAQSNYRSCEQISDMLSALEYAPPATRARLLKAFDMPILRGGMSMFDRALVTESESPTPDWAALSRVLERAVALSRQWHATACEEGAVRVLSIIYAEHLNDDSAAQRVLEDAGVSGRLVLEEQSANLAYGRKDYEEAIRIWDECLWGSSLGEAGVRDPFALRKAGMACAKLGRYADAARWFERAAALVEAVVDVMPSALFRIDASQCWFRAGAHADALRELGLAWCSVNRPVDAQQDPRVFAAQRFLGNLAGWIGNAFEPRARTQQVMWIGGASRPDLNIEALRAEPAAQLDMLAGVLVRVCSFVGADMPGLAEAIALAESSNEPMVAALCRSARIGRLVREGNFTDVGVQVGGLLSDVARQQALMADGGAVLGEQMNQVASYAFAWSLSLATLGGVDRTALMDAWEAALAGPAGNQKALALAREAAAKFGVSPDSAMDLVRNAQGFVDRIGAASVALASDALSTLEAAQAQWVLAYNLTAPGGRGVLHAHLGGVADAFSRDWQRRLAAPALLNSPRTSIPALQAAIGLSGAPAARILTLALAAAQACGSSAPEHILTQLRAAANAAEEAERRLRSLGEVVPA
ncbi:MAG: tetratricopeptide repeat protein [Variovorax sp.]|nr:tetratricopeptide repeat protein [Variovorax sp.]